MTQPYEQPIVTIELFAPLERLARGDDNDRPRNGVNPAADDGNFDGGVDLESSIF